MTKILWMSNAPWAGTGYGQQTAMFTTRLRDDGHDVAILAFYGLEGSLGEWEGMTVYPTDHTRLGKHFLPEYTRHHGNGDHTQVQVITLMDLWTLFDPRLGGMARTKGLKMASWIPIDHDPCPPRVCQAIEETKTFPIAMSKFGQEKLAEAGIQAAYIPHGVETKIFKDYSASREVIRKSMGIPNDKFVVGMVANNQGSGPPRKAFPQVMQAFASFQKEHSDAFLYLHTDVLGLNDGINLLALSEVVGIPGDSIGTVDQFKYHIGEISPVLMAHLYSAFDVLIMPSYGEGFGVPLIEAQACGTPVITSDWTAMPELVAAGWKVQGDAWYDSAHGSFYMCPAVMEIYDALEQSYQARGDVDLRKQAVEGMKVYDSNHVFENHWKPVMAAIEEKNNLDSKNGSKIVLSSNVGREERRAAERASKRKTKSKSTS